MADLRRRRKDKQDYGPEPSGSDADYDGSLPDGESGNNAKEKQLEPGSYWLTRIVFIRALGFIYCNSMYSKEDDRVISVSSTCSCGIPSGVRPEQTAPGQEWTIAHSSLSLKTSGTFQGEYVQPC